MIALTKQVRNPGDSASYPSSMNTSGKRALFDNLGRDETKALALHEAVIESRQDDWRGHLMRERRVKNSIRDVLEDSTPEVIDSLFEIVKNNYEY